MRLEDLGLIGNCPFSALIERRARLCGVAYCASIRSRCSRRSSMRWRADASRSASGAAVHTQNDIYGEMILALSPLYLDDRFADERSPETLALVERLADRAVALQGTPDAGIWEYRTEWQPQTFSSPHVLGRRRSHVAHRRAPRARPMRSLRERRRAHPRAHRQRGVERAARQLRRHAQRTRSRRGAAPNGADAAVGRQRSKALRTVDAMSTSHRTTAGSIATTSMTASAAPKWPSCSARSG